MFVGDRTTASTSLAGAAAVVWLTAGRLLTKGLTTRCVRTRAGVYAHIDRRRRLYQ